MASTLLFCRMAMGNWRFFWQQRFDFYTLWTLYYRLIDSTASKQTVRVRWLQILKKRAIGAHCKVLFKFFIVTISMQNWSSSAHNSWPPLFDSSSKFLLALLHLRLFSSLQLHLWSASVDVYTRTWNEVKGSLNTDSRTQCQSYRSLFIFIISIPDILIFVSSQAVLMLKISCCSTNSHSFLTLTSRLSSIIIFVTGQDQ